MSVAYEEYLESVTRSLRTRLRRHRLVFVQCGAVFGKLKADLVDSLDGQVLPAEDFAKATTNDTSGLKVLTDIAVFIDPPASRGASLGELRIRVSEALDRGCEVCLLSSAPRVAYPPIPGSSLLDDSSPFFIDLLPELDGDPASIYPAVKHGDESLFGVLARALPELGSAMLASLDRAIFDGQLDRDVFIDVLEPREIEALRGAGLARVLENDRPLFSIPNRFAEFKDALAGVLAEYVVPQEEFAVIAEGLWTMERTIRRKLREAALEKFAERWRSQVLHGDLPQKALDRARADAVAGARSVRELRDPIEWLSLGELLEVIGTSTFSHLDLPPAFWNRFAQEVVPVRNRLSHMRLFKTGDRNVVTMWSSQIKRMLRAE